jgi:hypothetical protein
VTLQIDKSITPVAQAYPTPPQEKGERQTTSIIERADGATPWLSPLIAIPKKTGDVRLVLDMRVPNLASPLQDVESKYPLWMKSYARWKVPNSLPK